MGYYTLLAPCFACKRLFHSNPTAVPSYNGEPICRTCMEAVNARREATGQPLWPVPPDAYDPAEEGTMP